MPISNHPIPIEPQAGCAIHSVNHSTARLNAIPMKIGFSVDSAAFAVFVSDPCSNQSSRQFVVGQTGMP
jgi:hypothetical protein